MCNSDFPWIIPRSGIAGPKGGNIFKALGVYYPVAFQNGCAISYQQYMREPNWGNLYLKKALFNTSSLCWSWAIPILFVILLESPRSTVVVCSQGRAGQNVHWPGWVTDAYFRIMDGTKTKDKRAHSHMRILSFWPDPRNGVLCTNGLLLTSVLKGPLILEPLI